MDTYLIGEGRDTKWKRWRCGLLVLLSTCCGAALVMSSVSLAREDPSQVMQNGFMAVRLMPGDDLRSGVMAPVLRYGLKAAWMVSCAGSLSQFAIRFANESNVNVSAVSHFEIVSLSGTLSSNSYGGDDGSGHLHIAVSDSNGRTYGGHLASGVNSTVYTTVEVVIGYSCAFEFQRGKDGSTPWDELQIIHQSWC
jgi:predicted DNA-binding protein with PD1-like motif